MKRILIAAALCLVSFQSYAESEMTFQEFGDVIYSEDKSAYFVRYTDTAVNKQKVMKALNYSAGTYGDANGFRDACLAKCAGKEKCGGVVFQYYNNDKKTPKKCNFKALEPTTKANNQKKKDFYRRICYVGGPGGYLSPEDGSSDPVICRLFGKNVVELADGSFIVEDEPPVTEKLQSDLGTPWVPGKMLENDSPCWCNNAKCLSYPAWQPGTSSAHWIAGINGYKDQAGGVAANEKLRSDLSREWDEWGYLTWCLHAGWSNNIKQCFNGVCVSKNIGDFRCWRQPTTNELCK